MPRNLSRQEGLTRHAFTDLKNPDFARVAEAKPPVSSKPNPGSWAPRWVWRGSGAIRARKRRRHNLSNARRLPVLALSVGLGGARRCLRLGCAFNRSVQHRL